MYMYMHDGGCVVATAKLAGLEVSAQYKQRCPTPTVGLREEELHSYSHSCAMEEICHSVLCDSKRVHCQYALELPKTLT